MYLAWYNSFFVKLKEVDIIEKPERDLKIRLLTVGVITCFSLHILLFAQMEADSHVTTHLCLLAQMEA